MKAGPTKSMRVSLGHWLLFVLSGTRGTCYSSAPSFGEWLRGTVSIQPNNGCLVGAAWSMTLTWSITPGTSHVEGPELVIVVWQGLLGRHGGAAQLQSLDTEICCFSRYPVLVACWQ